jgi:hypothetical protein
MIRHISPGRATVFVSESVFEFVFVFEGETRVRSAATPSRTGAEIRS